MCTIGAVSNLNNRGERLGVLMKTVDGPPLEIFHGYFRIPDTLTNRAVFTSLMCQRGINIGMNQYGLAATISYSDFVNYSVQTARKIPTFDEDTRALITAEILSSCKTVYEGIAHLKDFVPKYPNQFGGNHLLIDAEGRISLLEQSQGKCEYHDFSERGYCGRANNSHWLIKKQQQNLITPLDSLPREDAIEAFLNEIWEKVPQGITSGEIVSEAKSLLSRHSETDNQVGGICVHALKAPGARIFGDTPCNTLGAVILDMKELTMHYSMGNPCYDRWNSLKLE
jgi:hypothetical protein